MAIDPARNKLLAQVKRDMKVIDVDGADVGTVSFVHMADTNDPDDVPARRDDDDAVPLLNLVEGDEDDDDTGLIDVLTGDDNEPNERLRRSGYVKIDASGFMAGDKYATPAHIASVDGQRVRLNVRKDDL